MKQKLSEEQLDLLVRSLLEDSVDDGSVNEIADSPALWWSVQRAINEQKAATRSPWPPVGKWLRLILAAAPVAAAVIVGLGIYRLQRPTFSSADTASVSTEPTTMSANAPSEPATTLIGASDLDEEIRSVAKNTVALSRPESKTQVAVRSVANKETTTGMKSAAVSENAKRPVGMARSKAPVTALPGSAKTAVAEIKSDFIALSYARSPESGQLVRVRVPSSMMVTLGLVSSVSKPSALVDAEVLVGDDGTTHSIRFIR